MSIFRIAHLSDPHLPPPAGAFGWRDLASKRLLSRIAWRRKHKEHQPDVLAALVADIKTYAPDHIAVTGDLTNFASTVEVEAARHWLNGLGASDRITLSPGNHDALVGATGPERFAAWSDWLGDGDEVAFPRLRIRDGVAIINLCSAIPTAPHLATGRLGQAQLTRLEALLADPAHRDLFRVVLIHHPPTPGAVSRRKSLDDREGLGAILARQGVDLVLHGHAHEGLVATTPGPDGAAIPVLGVPSASALGRGKHPAARWHAIEITRDGADAVSVRVIARGLDPQTGDVAELGRYVLA
ncbi:metallophosphoesterase family protein [Caulobacter sp. ErkDOM-E]|uniref:metallophosphoesterase family protein n=1 Tax=Caulobacter sp. ErkDOM-E TaxID=3402778 RepID=UPI003AF6B7A2